MAPKNIGVINYGIGNLASVRSALLHISTDSFLIESPQDFDRATHVILPGVGAFGIGMKNLIDRGFDEALTTRVVQKGKPLLGICLGMQLLGSFGTEFGQTKGLGFIPGKILKLETQDLRLPHVGWNDIQLKKTDDVFTADLNGQAFYFVHSFALHPDSPADIAATTDYGQAFVACASHERVYGAQFHPEKSQKWGLKLLKNFCELPC